MNENSLYFFSDVHFGIKNRGDEKFREKLLVDFLTMAEKDAEHIYIVGDLFDCWIEYKEVVPKGFYRFLTKLSDIIEKGIKVTFLAGNHDFWRGGYFKDEFGIDMKLEPVIFERDGKKFYLHHGDGLAYNDKGYLILRKILRNKFNQFLYSIMHPDLGIKLARSTSSSSRIHTDQKDYTQKDGLKDFAIKKIDSGFNFIIMGHRHKPMSISHNSGLYINLGDWLHSFTYAKYSDKELKLYRYYDTNKNKVVNELI